MKKLLVPFVALLAFSVLATSASAFNGLYSIRFRGRACGECGVYEDPYGSVYYWPGDGRIYISGVASGPEHDVDYYYSEDIWIHRAHMSVSTQYARYSVYFWSPQGPMDGAYGYFYDYDHYSDSFYVWLRFSSYYFMDGGGPMYFSGWAWMHFRSGYVWVELWQEGAYPILAFEWYHSWAHVTAWPLGYPAWD